MRAQRRRVDLDNINREANADQLHYQDAVIGTLAVHWYLSVRKAATWLHELIRGLPKDKPVDPVTSLGQCKTGWSVFELRTKSF